MHQKPPHPDPDNNDDKAAQQPPPPASSARRDVAPNLPPFGGLPSRSEIPSTRYPSHAPAAMGNSSDGNDESRGALPVAPVTSSSPPTAPFPCSNSSTASASRSNVLTPTSGTSILDGTSPSPGINGSSSQQSPVGGSSMYFPPGHSHGSWPTPTAPAYSYSSSSPASGVFPSRPSFNHSLASPQLSQYPGRTSASPANGEALPSTSTYQDHSTFPSPAGGGGGGNGGAGSNGTNTGLNGGLGSFGSTLNSQPHGTSPSGLALPILSGAGQTGPQPSPNQSPMGGPAAGSEGHIYRSPSASWSHPPVSSPQQGAFPYASQPGPSPTLTTGPLSGRAPLMSGMSSPMYPGPPRPHHMPPATYSQFPSIQGPIMSNVHQPNHPMAIYSHPHQQYQMHPHMYLGNQPHQQQQERPFKCETCPQSFNRNHDLKRHTRIHLAVKPFPCDKCDKSFSRKDALKRHRLVKGCEAKDKDTSNTTHPNAQGESPTSDGDMTSPTVFKKEH